MKRQSAIHASAWGLLAGLVGSLCCIGPSAAILLGLGASSVLLGFTLDRALALGGGAALLVGGAVLAVRRARACNLRPAARWRSVALMLASSALSYALLGLLVPALAARQEDTAAAAQQQPVVTAARLRRVTLSIEKMDCPPCATHLRSALKRQKAVRALVAETGNDEVKIDYDSSQTTANKLVAFIPTYYGVTLISDQALP